MRLVGMLRVGVLAPWIFFAAHPAQSETFAPITDSATYYGQSGGDASIHEALGPPVSRRVSQVSAPARSVSTEGAASAEQGSMFAPSTDGAACGTCDGFGCGFGCGDDASCWSDAACCEANECGATGWGCGPIRLVAGAEYLRARPSFSEPLAFIRQVRPVGQGSNGIQENIDEGVFYEFDRQDSVRAYLGLRLDECCSEIRFTYWQLNSDARVGDVASTDANGNDVFLDIYEVTAVLPGERLDAQASVGGNVYDLTYSRCLMPQSNCCQDPCGCCPNWQLNWSAGIRGANWEYETSVVSTSLNQGRADTRMEFSGAGPLVGLDGRYGFRRIPWAAAYAKFDTALLLGEYSHELVRTAQVGPNTNVERFLADDIRRVIPVTTLEVGMAWQVTQRLDLMAGWFHQVWWDLGMTEDTVSDILFFSRDDSNIMAWDGLTLQAQWVF